MNDMNNEQIIVDKVTGKAQNGFRFQFMQSNGKKKKGKLMTVIPEEPEQFDVMVKAFQAGAAKTGEKLSETVKMQSTARVQAE